MTNEEKLREVFPKTIFIYRKEDDKTAAIQCSNEWLNAEYKESTTKNNLGVDCISKAKALDCVNWGYNLSDVYKKINELPSVTPIRPKGHWIDKQHSFETCSAECSSCHERSNGYVFDNGFSLECEYYDFCPKCGSDNREVEE